MQTGGAHFPSGVAEVKHIWSAVLDAAQLLARVSGQIIAVGGTTGQVPGGTGRQMAASTPAPASTERSSDEAVHAERQVRIRAPSSSARTSLPRRPTLVELLDDIPLDRGLRNTNGRPHIRRGRRRRGRCSRQRNAALSAVPPSKLGRRAEPIAFRRRSAMRGLGTLGVDLARRYANVDHAFGRPRTVTIDAAIHREIAVGIDVAGGDAVAHARGKMGEIQPLGNHRRRSHRTRSRR